VLGAWEYDSHQSCEEDESDQQEEPEHLTLLLIHSSGMLEFDELYLVRLCSFSIKSELPFCCYCPVYD
jgi:hypothetical protein